MHEGPPVDGLILRDELGLPLGPVDDDHVHLAPSGQLHDLAGSGRYWLDRAGVRVPLLELLYQLIQEARIADAGSGGDDKLVADAAGDR